jgi:hypothetical protein
VGRRPRTPDLKGISRIDAKGTHGWYVRIYRQGKTYSRLFSDSKYGTKERALKFAKKERDILYANAHNLPDKPNRRLVTHDRRNKSGIIGVSRTVKQNKNDTTSVYFQVTWSPRKGEIKNRQWSVKKYGEDEAFRLAKEFRAKVMFDIYGDRYEEMIKEQAAIDSGYEPD